MRRAFKGMFFLAIYSNGILLLFSNAMMLKVAYYKPSQVGPLYPARHVQLSPELPGTHVPPLRQTVARQCSSSGKIK